ncbi:hypothetical protein [Candidatus Halocynthiibacter alkanivorans]|uniref:hypothetical protein n=1 Tax=Candidatus Halocynthiibacter alkanivorans TaxID=2267619 RepID=UPI00109C2067|nr:hypothetical protein [Candidatus Halocynthiibacter alkanivorans]
MLLRSNYTAAKKFLIALGLASLTFAGTVAPVFSQTATAIVTNDGTAASVAQTIVTDGFRSAKFGMDAEAVRAAILTDFGIEDGEIQAGENAVERTQVLTVAVPNLILDGGTAQVSYVFGYSTQNLIQVGATWSAKTDPAMTTKILYDNGDVLRSYFMADAYAPDSVRVNVALPNGILMFRGADAEDRATLLLLQGTFSIAEDGSNILTPASLDLLYSSDPNEPDIFSLPDGAF